MFFRRLLAGCFRSDKVDSATRCKSCSSYVSTVTPDDEIKSVIHFQANAGSRYLGQDLAPEVLPTLHQAAFRGMLDHYKGPVAAIACIIQSIPASAPHDELRYALPWLRTLWLHMRNGSDSSGISVSVGELLKIYESYLTDLGRLTTLDEAILAGVEAAARCAVRRQYCTIRHRIRLDGEASATATPYKSMASAAQWAILEAGSCVLDVDKGKRMPGLTLVIRAPSVRASATSTQVERCPAINFFSRNPGLLLQRTHSVTFPTQLPPVIPRGFSDRDLTRMRRAASGMEPSVGPGPRASSTDNTMLATRALAAESIPAMVMAFSFDRSGGSGSVIYVNHLARGYLNLPPAAEAKGAAAPIGAASSCGLTRVGSRDLADGGCRLPQLDVRLLLLELLSGAGISWEEILREAEQQQGFSVTIKAPAAIDVMAMTNGCTATRAPVDVAVDSPHRGGAGAARPRLLMNGIAECDEVELQGDNAGNECAAGEGGCDCSGEHDERGKRLTQPCQQDLQPPPMEREGSMSTSDGQPTPILRGAHRPVYLSLLGHDQRQGSVASSVGLGLLASRTESFALASRIDSSTFTPPEAGAASSSASASFTHGHVRGNGHALVCPPEALRQRLMFGAAAGVAEIQEETAEQLLLQRLSQTTVARQAREVSFQRTPYFQRWTTSPADLMYSLSAAASDPGCPQQPQPHPQTGKQRQQWQQQQQQASPRPVDTANDGDGDHDRGRGREKDPSGVGVSSGGNGIAIAASSGGAWLDLPVSDQCDVNSSLVKNANLVTHKSPNTVRGIRRQVSSIETSTRLLPLQPDPFSCASARDILALTEPSLSLSGVSGAGVRLEGRTVQNLRRACTEASSELSMRVAALCRNSIAPLYLEPAHSEPESIPALTPEPGAGAVAPAVATTSMIFRRPVQGSHLGDSLKSGPRRKRPQHERQQEDGLLAAALCPESLPGNIASVRGQVPQLVGGYPTKPSHAAGTGGCARSSGSPAAGRSEAPPGSKPRPHFQPTTSREEEPGGSAEAVTTADCCTARSCNSLLSPHSSESAQPGSSYMLTETCGPRGCAAASSEAAAVSLLASVPVLTPAAGPGTRSRPLGVLRAAQQLTMTSSGRSSTETFSQVYGTVAVATKMETNGEGRQEVDDGTVAERVSDAAPNGEHGGPLALSQEIDNGQTIISGADGGAAERCQSVNAAIQSPSLSAAAAPSSAGGVFGKASNECKRRIRTEAHCGNSWLPIYPSTMEETGVINQSPPGQGQSQLGAHSDAQARPGQNQFRSFSPGKCSIQGNQPADAGGGACGGGGHRGAPLGIHSSSLFSSCWLAPGLGPSTVMGSSGQLAELGQRGPVMLGDRGGRMLAGAGGIMGRVSVGYPLLMMRGGSASQHPGLPTGSLLGSIMIDGSIGDIGQHAAVCGQMDCKGVTTGGGGSGGAGDGDGTCDSSATVGSATAASLLSIGDRSLMNKLISARGTVDSSYDGDGSRLGEGGTGISYGTGKAGSATVTAESVHGRLAPPGAGSGSRLTELVASPTGAVVIPRRTSSIPRSCSRLNTGPAALGSSTPQKRPHSVRTRLYSLLQQMDKDDGFSGTVSGSPLCGLSPIEGEGGSAGGSGASGLAGYMFYGNGRAQGRPTSAMVSASASPMAPLAPARRASTTVLEGSVRGIPYSGLEVAPTGPVAGVVPPSRASFCSASSSDNPSGPSRLLLLQTRASSVGPGHHSHAPHLRDFHHLSHSHVNTTTSEGSQNTTSHSLALQLRLMTSGLGHSHSHYQNQVLHAAALHPSGCGQVSSLVTMDASTLQGLGWTPPDTPGMLLGATIREPASTGVSASGTANIITTGASAPCWTLPFQVQMLQGGVPSPVPRSAACAIASSAPGNPESAALRRVPSHPSPCSVMEGPSALSPLLPSGPERSATNLEPARPGSEMVPRVGSAVGSGVGVSAAPDGNFPVESRRGSGAAAMSELVALGSRAVSERSCWFRVHIRCFPAMCRQPGSSNQRGRNGGAADGAGVSTLLMIMQDVTLHMTAQERVTTLLGHEHRILEALFPRHVIEFMTVVPVEMAAAGVRGRARDASRSRARSRRFLDASPVTMSLASSARANSNRSPISRGRVNTQADGARGRLSDGGGGDGDNAVGNNAQHSHLPSDEDVMPSASSSSGRGSGWRQLVMQRQLDAIKVSHLATQHKMVTILFSDCVGFTAMCKKISPLAVMHFLNELYQKLDALLDIYKVYKVETIGDCYVVAGGLVRYDSDGYCSVLPEGEIDELHAVRVMEFGKAMLRASREVALLTTGEPVKMRLGLHSGPAMSGVVGSKMPRFTVFGETVEAAHRMESSGVPGCIHVSGATREFLRRETWEQTEGVKIDSGQCMDTFLWAEEQSEDVLNKQRAMDVYL